MNVPIKGSKNNYYGSVYQNAGAKARGTLVWGSTENEFSVQVVMSAAELAVVKRTGFWAQGGISMNLGIDSRWATKAQIMKICHIVLVLKLSLMASF